MTGHLERKDGLLQLERTGPFVPPMTLTSDNIVVTDALRKEVVGCVSSASEPPNEHDRPAAPRLPTGSQLRLGNPLPEARLRRRRKRSFREVRSQAGAWERENAPLTKGKRGQAHILANLNGAGRMTQPCAP